MPTLVLIRRPHIEGQPTQGSFLFESAPNILRHTMVRCLELEWKGNAKGISCIPEGTYPMRFTMSNRFGKLMWEIQNVPDRAGIRIHAGNFAGTKLTDSEGCLLPCAQWADINGDGVIDGTGSRKALEELLTVLRPYEVEGIEIRIERAEK